MPDDEMDSWVLQAVHLHLLERNPLITVIFFVIFWQLLSLMKLPQMAIKSNFNSRKRGNTKRTKGVGSTWRQGGDTSPETIEWDWSHEALSPPPSSWWRWSRLVGCVTNRLQEELHQQDMRPFSTRRAKWRPHHISSFVYSEFGMQVDGAGPCGISHSHLCSDDVQEEGFWLWALQSRLTLSFQTLVSSGICCNFQLLCLCLKNIL